MKISQAGLEKIADRLKAVVAELNELAGNPRMTSGQRERFRDLQEEMREKQKFLRAVSDPFAGT